jgi:hypothetical protein
MIHNLKHPNRKKNPARFLKDMEQELYLIKSRWQDPDVSKRALKEYPEFARGYLTMLTELLCVPFDQSQFKDLPKK